MKYEVMAYRSGTLSGFRSFFYDSLEAAKEKRAELLACLPIGFEVHIKRLES